MSEPQPPSTPTCTDSPITLALRLAHAVRWQVPPNPAVGCVLAAPDGTVLGQGATQRTGGPHAEVMALRDAQARGQSVAGATAWVTLEPCAHQGRTGPCCDALIAAGIGRVVASLEDPNPRVAGQGLARLRAAGVAVEVGPGAAEARALNLGFFSRMVRRTPWVRLKSAITLDGRTALANGVSQWITGAAARADGHAWRARAGAILTGVGTVLHDDPRLDVRLDGVPEDGGPWRQPPLAIVDSQLRTPSDAQVFAAARPVWIYTAKSPAERDAARAQALESAGAVLIAAPGATGQVDLRAVLADLAAREVNDLHVEAGQRLHGALLRENLVDELLVYMAPKLVGEGMGLAANPMPGGPLSTLAGALPLVFDDVARIDHDLRIVARLQGRDEF